MNIYFIKAPSWKYDGAESFVIAARNESEVRNIASSNCGLEGEAVWLNEAAIECIGVASSHIKQPRMIVREFHAG